MVAKGSGRPLGLPGFGARDAAEMIMWQSKGGDLLPGGSKGGDLLPGASPSLHRVDSDRETELSITVFPCHAQDECSTALSLAVLPGRLQGAAEHSPYPGR